jgi:NAD(P)-dependent dehydrogenase (short-subunit alcohol dehydrogenase family)
VAKWTDSDIPDQSGRTVLITGANSGLGLHSALPLARRGAKVLLACRSAERGRAALAQVAAAASTKPELVELDLADLGSVRRAAADVRERTADALDVLMNNAGVLAPPKRETRDGFELQIGTNHLGHAALTWLLMPALRERPGARVVTVSSLAHQGGSIDTADLNFTRRRYSPFAAYAQSKLANLLFAFQLDRYAREHGLDLVSVAAHPGVSDTEIALNSVKQHSLPTLLGKGARLGTKLISQPVTKGVLPQLFAATAPGISGGQYYGPDGIREMRGHPKLAKASSTARDRDIAERLWKVTTELTGVAADPG